MKIGIRVFSTGFPGLNREIGGPRRVTAGDHLLDPIVGHERLAEFRLAESRFQILLLIVIAGGVKRN